MSMFRECPYHRVTESIGMGKGLGYCDLDGSQTICDGDTKFCGKPDVLQRYLIIRMLEKRLQEVEE
jgi:hypothetical protein